MKKIKPCIICEGTNFNSLFINGTKTIEQCSSCALTRTKNFVEPNYLDYHRDNEYEASEKFFKNFFEMRYNLIKNYRKIPGKILDIGASTGVMLDVFKKNGWETYGVEPSESFKIASDKGHNISHTTFDKAKVAKDNFDLIIANHVLEHIEEANTFLKKCKLSLKKGGLLYIDVPNFGSLSSTIAGKNWKYLLPNEHVYHFTPETLTKLLESNDFKVLSVNTRSGVLEAANPIQYLLDELFSFKKNFFYDLVGIPGNIISTSLQKGSSLGIISCEK